jgi:metallo-beta-lactamase class B
MQKTTTRLTVSALALLFLTLALPTGCLRQQRGVPASMTALNRPSQPFRIVGNVHFVGTSGMGVFLITTPAGHILLDTGFDASVPLVAGNVRRLGFKFEDIKILLASHAHVDHVGGHNRVRQMTGARVLISEGDAPLLRAGGRGDHAYGDKLPFPPCEVDGFVRDQEQIQLGGTTMIAHLTPGHTPGATTWTTIVDDRGRALEVLFYPSGTVSPGSTLKENTLYPEIVPDFERSFALWKAMPCDVFLGSHTAFFDLETKRAKLGRAPGANPFIDPQGFRRLIAEQEKLFRDLLARE